MIHHFIASDSPVNVQFLTLGTTVVVFILFLLLAMKFVWPHILKGLDQREQKLRDDLDAADEARQQAKDALYEYEQELAKARSKVSEMISKAKQDAKVAAEELRSSNTKELVELKLAAASDIESAKQAAIGKLHAEASTLAVAIASKILHREITSEDQQSLVDESLSEMARTSK